MMNTISTVLGCIFGYMCLTLSLLVSAETIMRKVFDASLQGADELGGYTLAISSSLAFSVALIGRNHMRIDLIHFRLPLKVQALLNWLASMTIAAFGALLSWTTFSVLADTVAYRSTAPTPWATPLVYPQSLWYVCLTMFALVSILLALRATYLLARGKLDALNTNFNPKAAKEELAEELEDVKSRS